MGAWSGEPFGNDTASDWLWELDDSSDWDVVRGALDLAVGGDEELDADVATNAIAAAAVVAQGIGHSAKRNASAADDDDADLDDDGDEDVSDDEASNSIDAFLNRAGEPSADLVQLAISALDAATGPSSELTDLWNESGADEWEKANAAVRADLGG
jgi:hypothetical protein